MTDHNVQDMETLAQRPVRRQHAAHADIRLTSRGALVGLFVLCFLTLLLADLTGWTAIADLAFVAGSGAAAWYTKRGALLAVTVSPPVIFLVACMLAEWIAASGTFQTLEGIFVTLGTSAPWLFIGTGLTLAIGFYRGLGGEIMDHIAELRGRLPAGANSWR
jgi:hypothetical protein